MSIKTVSHLPYSPDLVSCDFWLFPKLRGCRYETIEEMKEAVTKVIDTLTQEDFHGAFQKFLERYNKCIATGGDYFERDYSLIVATINKSAHMKKGLETYRMHLVFRIFTRVLKCIYFRSSYGLIDFNEISTRLGLFDAWTLENRVRITYIVTFLRMSLFF